MIGLIPVFQNDYHLLYAYIILSMGLLFIKKTRSDIPVFFIGLIFMTISEYFFLKTGVEEFTRKSLFGIMPIWLPVLWAYGFVTIKRIVETLNNNG